MEVIAIRMQADNYRVETYKAKIRDKKHKHNSPVVVRTRDAKLRFNVL